MVLYQIRATMGTRSVPTFESKSLDDALSRLDEIVDLFKSKGLISFTGHNFSPVEQVTLIARLGDVFNWNICTATAGEWPSEESAEQKLFYAGHSDNPDKEVGREDDYALEWHIEQVFYVNPVLAGTWNMVHFACPPRAGRTFFADSTELYSMLSDADQDFLSKSVIRWDKPIGPKTGFGPFYTNAIAPHPISGLPTIRIEADGGCIILPELYKHDGQDPTDEQIATYRRLYLWLRAELFDNEEIRYVQQWTEGNMVLVDLFKMYHAVTDGFGPGERTIRGAFLRPNPYNADLYTSLELL